MPKRKAVNKKKKPSNANKQRQAVNVKIKIDQSRRTNPREPRATARASGLPARAYTANSSTPLHTTIMTATPSPAVIQQEPNYAETVKNMFREAEQRQNNQLALMADTMRKRDNQFNQLVQQTRFPPTKELYNLLMNEHQSRFSGGQADVDEMPDEVETEGVSAFTPVKAFSAFNDPNAKVQATLRTPLPPSPPPEEESSQQPAGANPSDSANEKKKRGRKPLTDEEKQKRAEEATAKKAEEKVKKAEEKAKRAEAKALQKKIQNTRAKLREGLASPLAQPLQKKPKKKPKLVMEADEEES